MKKLGLLVLALVIALGSLGVGYAKWSDNVTIQGQVTSGSVCLQWVRWNNPDPCSSAFSVDPKYDENDFDARWDKDVACTTIAFGKNPDGSTNKHELVVTVNNAYPGYYIDAQLEWINCGTIPIKLETLSIVPNNFTISKDLDWTNPDKTGEIYLEWSSMNLASQHVQYHPGEKGTTSLLLLVDQSAEQGATYTFTITLVGSQWNEVN